MEISREGTGPVQPLQGAPEIIDRKRGDVTGDRIPDIVLLLGIRPDPASPFIEGLTLIVLNGITGAETRVVPPVNSGYNPYLFLGDFTGEGAQDVLLHIDTGGSGGFIDAFLYAFNGIEPRLLFSSEQFNEASHFSVVFQNDYRVAVTDLTTGTVFTIDISNWPPDVLREIYDENGRLLAPIVGEVSPLVALYPIVTDQTGVFRLLALQRIIGRFEAETLGYVETLLAWNGAGFVAVRVSVCTTGVTPTV